MAGAARTNGSAILGVFVPARASVNPPLRQAANTLGASVSDTPTKATESQ
ncbi:hypothetical protein FACS1894174_10310 [Bacteroidia bacterium]|nr:hypothetical protein FACS1894174_10310 [Bacteroidia bacterium]